MARPALARRPGPCRRTTQHPLGAAVARPEHRDRQHRATTRPTTRRRSPRCGCWPSRSSGWSEPAAWRGPSARSADSSDAAVHVGREVRVRHPFRLRPRAAQPGRRDDRPRRHGRREGGRRRPARERHRRHRAVPGSRPQPAARSACIRRSIPTTSVRLTACIDHVVGPAVAPAATACAPRTIAAGAHIVWPCERCTSSMPTPSAGHVVLETADGQREVRAAHRPGSARRADRRPRAEPGQAPSSDEQRTPDHPARDPDEGARRRVPRGHRRGLRRRPRLGAALRRAGSRRTCADRRRGPPRKGTALDDRGPDRRVRRSRRRPLRPARHRPDRRCGGTLTAATTASGCSRRTGWADRPTGAPTGASTCRAAPSRRWTTPPPICSATGRSGPVSRRPTSRRPHRT